MAKTDADKRTFQVIVTMTVGTHITGPKVVELVQSQTRILGATVTHIRDDQSEGWLPL